MIETADKPLALRRYQPSDYDACRKLWAELTEHHRQLYDDPNIGGDDPGAAIDAYLKDERLRGPWVAVHEGRVVGLAGLLLEGEQAEIEPVIVTSAHRGQGIGRELVRHLVEQARALETRFLSVRPVFRNARAMSFFAEAGFGLVGQVELFQDLKPEAGRTWRTDLILHGRPFGY
jgi:N-acetylglutamate synthase-like GNAT family acetyltransferase